MTWPGDLTLSDLGLNFSEHVRKKCMKKNGKAVCQKPKKKKTGRGPNTNGPARVNSGMADVHSHPDSLQLLTTGSHGLESRKSG